MTTINEQAINIEKSADNMQIHVVVNGCKVKLNFPLESESSTINDVKRMMLGGTVKL